MKVYVLDTNVLILNNWAPYILSGNQILDTEAHERFLRAMEYRGTTWKQEPNDVVICDVVLRELDRLSHDHRRTDHIHRFVSLVTRTLESMIIAHGGLKQTQQHGKKHVQHYPESGRYGSNNPHLLMPNTARIYIPEHDEKEFLRRGIPEANTDDRIIYVAEQLRKARPQDNVILVSCDRIARMKAMARGIVCEDFEIENIRDPNQLYTGIREIVIPLKYEEIDRRISRKEGFTIDDTTKRVIPVEIKPNQIYSFRTKNAVRDSGEDTTKTAAATNSASDEPIESERMYIAKLTDTGFDFRPLRTPGSIADLIRKHSDETETHVDPFSAIITASTASQIASAVATLVSNPEHLRPETNHKTIQKYLSRLSTLPPTDLEGAQRIWREMQPILRKDTYKGNTVEQRDGKRGITIHFRLNTELVPKGLQPSYFHLLMDRSIPIISVNGAAGCGKTLFAILAGLLQVMDGRYDQITYMRRTVESDEGIGYLPGSKEQKMAPWAKPAIVSLMDIFGYYQADPKGKLRIEALIRELQDKRIIECEPLTYEGGNTWRNAWVVIDESQLTTHDQMKLIIGRIGLGTKLILSGDLNQVNTSRGKSFDYITERNSGLAHVIERLAGDRLYGHITLPKTDIYRSEAAKLVDRL